MSRRDEMSRLLIAIRGGRRQIEAGDLAGLSQKTISRLERGEGKPLAPDEAAAYAAALGATAEQRNRLVELAVVKTAGHITSRQTLVRSAPEIQARIGRLERDASLIRSWVPDMIPGILQSRAYTQAMLDGDGIVPTSEWWEARTARVDLLSEPGRTWHQVVSEAALRWPLGSRAATADQVEHLIELSELPHLQLGVIDLDTPKRFTAPRAFHLYTLPKSTQAVTATDVGTAFVDDSADVAHFTWTWGQIESAPPRYGDEARKLLARIARSLRRTR